MPSKRKRSQVQVIHGPNLNLLGLREPELYGRATLADIDAALQRQAEKMGVELQSFQSNGEGAIVDAIQAARGRVDGLIINPAAYTHTSVAIRDALLTLSVPIIEVHISNIHRREEFRRRSLISDVVTGQIVGLGARGYYLALQGLVQMLAENGG
jgi:3-dehydroquinate dehydratase II